ncbi:MAG: hypothetical protein RL684_1280 [Pseudomonadota bacterium]
MIRTAHGSLPLLAGVELGGTKCVCLLGTGPGDVRAQCSIPTGRDPARALADIVLGVQQMQLAHGPATALGVASFGPLDLDPASRGFGAIASTSKPGWSGVDVAGALSRALALPTRIETDVTGAALAEGRWGAARGLSSHAYVTVGTGVGVGIIAGGRPLQGFTHPEFGHIRVARLRGDDWAGSCPYHADCVEGLASGVAIERRTGVPAAQLPPDHPAWQSITHALAQLLHALVLATAPQRVLMGGGVLEGQPHLFARLRRELQRSLNGYVEPPRLCEPIDGYIGPPSLAAMAGPLGALALAADALAAAAAGRAATNGIYCPA